ncbi:MAG: 2-C-methyl-D-erythritol 4-phosphate cytidylyltransferase [Eubacteriales bacterium]|nr:2-C-methyl-D-erythritol 4-phosphate cytidylyltransferase [Eubacteriales bacterium]
MLNSEARQPVKVYGIIAAGGSSERFKSGAEPEQAEPSKITSKLAGRLVIEWSLAAFAASAQVDGYIVVANPQDIRQLQALLRTAEHPKLIDIISGGETRQESVFNAISYLSGIVDEPEKALILIHDGARPLLSLADLEKVISQLSKERCGAGLCTPVYDTIRRYSKTDPERTRVIPREECFLMQTPQGAPLKILAVAAKAARHEAKLYTDDLALLEAIGYPVRLVQGSRDNLKITTYADLKLAEFYLRSKLNEESDYYRLLGRA